MRQPIGTQARSASDGTVTLVARRGEGWQRLSHFEGDLWDGLALFTGLDDSAAHDDPALQASLPSGAEGAVRFLPGQSLLWRYGRSIDSVRVIRDDERGLVTWIAPGSERLEAVPADGRRSRDVPLTERFSVPWRIRESLWHGQGIVRVAPTAKPWSVWFFRRPDGAPDGAYINLELPHRRVGGDVPSIFTRDLVLDLWLDAEHPGSEDIWLKDADELDAAVAQGRYTPAQAEVVRAIADQAVAELLSEHCWPLGEGWERWMPDTAMNEPTKLPPVPAMEAARARTGNASLQD